MRHFSNALLLWLFLVAVPCQAALAHVGTSGGASASAASVGVSYSAGATANIIIVTCGDSVSIPTLANSPNADSWTSIVDTTTGGAHVVTFWASPTTTTAQTITCSCSGASPFCSILVDEFSGQNATPIDVSQGFLGTTSCGATTNSMAANGEAVIVGISDAVTAVGTVNGSAATKGGDDTQQDWSEWFIFGAGAGSGSKITGTYTGTAGGAFCNVVSIKAAGGAATVVPSLPLLGFGS